MLIIGIFYLIILIGCVLFYVLYVDIFSFYLLLAAIITPVLLLIAMLISARKIKMSMQSLSNSCSEGEIAPVVLSIKNDSIFAVSCIKITVGYKNLLDGVEKRLEIHTPLFAKNEQQICLKISAEYCGIIEVKLIKARIYDMIRLFSKRLRCKNIGTSVMVCPKMIPIEPQLALYQNFDSESDRFSKRQAGDDPSEIFQLHEYRPGDKMNRIHWKASVRQDELIVKEFSKPVSNDIAFIICPPSHMSENDSGIAESYSRIMCAAASLSFAMLENDALHTFIWSAGGKNISATVADAESYLNFLSMNFSYKTDVSDPYGAVYGYFSQLGSGEAPRFSHIIIITDGADEQLFDCLGSDERGLKKTVICCLPNSKKSPMPQETDDMTQFIFVGGESGMSALSDMII